MPLTRGSVLGYDARLMTYQFTMMNGANTVDCGISSAALDVLSKAGSTSKTNRDMVFLEHRDIIERVVRELFVSSDAAERTPVRLFAKHFSKELPTETPSSDLSATRPRA